MIVKLEVKVGRPSESHQAATALRSSVQGQCRAASGIELIERISPEPVFKQETQRGRHIARVAGWMRLKGVGSPGGDIWETWQAYRDLVHSTLSFPLKEQFDYPLVIVLVGYLE